MREERDYDDIPGTYVFDKESSIKGYHLNMFCMSLNTAEGREKFKANEEAYLRTFEMSEEQVQAVLKRDFLEMLRLGGNIYYTFKIAAYDGVSMQGAGAAMSGTGMSEADFRQMMIDGGRPIEGNRSKKENNNG
ncbi:MAG: protocatechuate 4,5-dioxygenase alpha chain [Sulfurimonas sp.]|jgi:protocatechuate 4,5-dioxygenase alpha chain